MSVETDMIAAVNAAEAAAVHLAAAFSRYHTAYRSAASEIDTTTTLRHPMNRLNEAVAVSRFWFWCVRIHSRRSPTSTVFKWVCKWRRRRQASSTPPTPG